MLNIQLLLKYLDLNLSFRAISKNYFTIKQCFKTLGKIHHKADNKKTSIIFHIIFIIVMLGNDKIYFLLCRKLIRIQKNNN